jgi:hypothetical protein
MSNSTLKLYNGGTLCIGSITVMNTCHERNRKLFLCQVAAGNSAVNGKYM